MKFFFLAFISLLPILLPFPAFSLNEEEVVQRLRESREKIKDFSADLFQEKKIFLLKEKVISRGRIRFKFPDRVFIEFFPPQSMQIALDGKGILLYFKEEAVAEYYRIHFNTIAERYLLLTRDPFQKGLADWRIREEKESFLILEILPKEKESLFLSTRLWVSKGNWMVMGMELVERNGDTTFIRYSNVKTNIGLTESDFEIRLPKDVKVREIR